MSCQIPHFILNSAFYPQFHVLSPIPRFIPDSAFYPQFRVLFPIPRFILNSAFYPQFRVLSPIPRFIPDSISAFRFRIPVPHSGSAFYPYPINDHSKPNILSVYNILQMWKSSMSESLVCGLHYGLHSIFKHTNELYYCNL